MLSLSGTCSASRRIWRSALRGTVASPSGCQPTQAFSPPQPPPSLLPPSFQSSLSTPPPISSSFSHYKRLLMLKLSVTSAPTADMATLTVVQPLTLDRGKGAAHPSGHCVPSASPSAPASSHRDCQTRSGRGSRATRRSEEGFRAESRILSSPFLCPPRPRCPLHASLARHKGAFAGLWRPRRHSQPLAGSPPGRRLCWSGGAGIARRPPGARGWWGAGRKLAEPGEGACSRRPGKPGEWAACQPTLPGAWEEGSLSPRRGARVGQAAGARAAARGRTRCTPCDLCRGARRLDCRGGELPSAERATRRVCSRAGAGGAASRQPCPALLGFPLWRRQGSRLPRRRRLSGSGNSQFVLPQPASSSPSPVTPRCPGCGRRWDAAQAGLKFNFWPPTLYVLLFDLTGEAMFASFPGPPQAYGWKPPLRSRPLRCIRAGLYLSFACSSFLSGFRRPVMNALSLTTLQRRTPRPGPQRPDLGPWAAIWKWCAQTKMI